MRERPYDAAIIGGGPAGCSAAIGLARSGARVVMCEARTYPHDKVCGEFLSPECVPLLSELGLPGALPGLGAVPIGGVRVSTPGGTAWETKFPAPGWGLSRRRFDAALAERARAAGAEVRELAPVLRVAGRLGEGFLLTVRSGGRERGLHATAVIAAHGKRSGLDQAIGRGFMKRRQPFVGLKAHFYGNSLQNGVELYTFPGGYCGLAEVEEGIVNVCLLARQDVFMAAAGGGPEAVERFIRWLRGEVPALDAWLGQATRLHERWLAIGQVPFASKDVVSSDILMAGDAAGLVAPLAGDGMAMALAAGSLAADSVCAYLAGGVPAATLRQGYAARWRREFAPRLRLGRLLQPALMRPWVTGLGLRLMGFAPGAGRLLVQGTRDLGPLLDYE